MRTKMYLTEQIRQSALGRLDYKLQQQFSRTRNIQDAFVSCLQKYANSTYVCDDASKHPCISKYNPSDFSEIACFAPPYRFSNLISDCSGHFHQYGQPVVCFLGEVLKSVYASLLSLVHFWLHVCYVLHRKYYGYALHTTSSCSAIRNRCHPPAPPSLVLAESFS